MKNPIFLSFLLILILCISQVAAVTVVGSRFSDNMEPGDSTSFEMVMKSDNLAEKNTPLTVSMDAGNCSEWVKTDTSALQLTPGGGTVKASIKVPADAYNGFYQCYVQYTGQPSGMVTSRIAVPVSLTISGGRDAPLPVITTATPTPKPTMNAPPIEAVIVPGVASPQPVNGPAPAFPIYGVFVAVLIGVFGIVLLYDYRRGRK